MIFFYCEFGAMVTNQFKIFNERLCQCNWYFFPIDVQRIFLIYMLDAQDPIFISGYGNILCTRDSFKNVIFLVDHEISRDLNPYIDIFLFYRPFTVDFPIL